MLWLAVSVLLAAASIAADGIDEQITRASDLAAPVRLQAAGKPIDVAGFAAPFVGDFNQDGKDDLLVGQLDHGLMRVYLNVGSGGQPTYRAYQWFVIGGRLASVPAGCAVGFTPQLVDFNGDGRKDILTGSFPGALLFVFPRDSDGSFLPAEVIEDRDGNVCFCPSRYNSTVFLHDWDSDGDPDLLLGRSQYYLARNLGTSSEPEFDRPFRITVDGREIPNGMVSPCIADWDADGKDDLICGRGYDVVWYRNIANSGDPIYQQARVLVGELDRGPQSDQGPDSLRQKPSRTVYAACVHDYDDDGRLDLLLGDHYYVARELSADQRASYTQYGRQRSEFWKRYRELIKEASEIDDRSERIRLFQDALADWSSLCKTRLADSQPANYRMQRHGGVWLYRRLSPQQ